MTESEFLRQRIVWASTGDAQTPYLAESAGRVLTVRIGDFPEESLYTLLVDGAAVAEFDDWPSVWVRPTGDAANATDTGAEASSQDGASGAESLPFARTNAEARLFLELQPCPHCGERRCEFRSAVVSVGDVLASRYTGVCPRCGRERVYQFRLPDEILPPPADSVRFGGEDPSQLLDPGVWLWYSDTAAGQVPADLFGLDAQSARTARHTLATALAALDEVLKFIPAGQDSVPAAAFTSLDGKAIYDNEPGRFTRLRLTAIRDYYAERLANW
ncbi:hypothetical protein [Nocardia callitridis]|uniref:Uncharacterized protein n=1 Tax=Nocardia callitridis TaxID=648753 RepID=A0ABP9KWD6_9NOCA